MQGEDCKASTDRHSDLEKIIDFEAHTSLYSGTIKIDDKVYELKDFATPEEVLAIITGAISKIPWADLQISFPDKSGVSGGSSSSSGPAASVSTGYTITLYEETGLKVDVGIADDWSGFILNVMLSDYKTTSSINIAVSGSMNIFATFTDWNEVKLVMNTLPTAPLSISGIPLIKPTVALTDVTIYFDWYNLAIVEKTGDMGKDKPNGIYICFRSQLDHHDHGSAEGHRACFIVELFPPTGEWNDRNKRTPAVSFCFGILFVEIFHMN